MNNRSNLANALLWGGSALLYFIATKLTAVFIFKVMTYLSLLLACMYLIRYLNNRRK